MSAVFGILTNFGLTLYFNLPEIDVILNFLFSASKYVTKIIGAKNLQAKHTSGMMSDEWEFLMQNCTCAGTGHGENIGTWRSVSTTVMP